jgi:hypothetical protein
MNNQKLSSSSSSVELLLQTIPHTSLPVIGDGINDVNGAAGGLISLPVTGSLLIQP